MKKLFGLLISVSLFTNVSFATTPSSTTPSIAAQIGGAPTNTANAAITPPPGAVNNPNFAIPNAPNVPAKAFILIDANSGAILGSENADERLPPASLTKLMTLYITFKELAMGRIKLTDMVPISENAWRTGGSRMFVKVGTSVSLDDLLQGVIVASGNDATMAIAEYVGGTEDAFVQLMDQETQTLGMKNTHYTDPTGLPAPDHYSSARDFSILTRAIIRDYPQYYHYFSEKWFFYNNIKQPNRNRLLWSNLNVDGLKTGHTEAAGYCLITSAKQNGMRLIAVVMGAPSDSARASSNQALLQYGFRFFQDKQVYSANETIKTVRVYGGANKQLNVGVSKDLAVTLPINAAKELTTDIQITSPLKAPITQGQVVGTVTIKAGNSVVATENLVALTDDPKGGWWRRFMDWLALLF